MGQKPKKYHVTDDGDVYRVNEDGSFTSVGNIQDIENKIRDTSTVVNPYDTESIVAQIPTVYNSNKSGDSFGNKPKLMALCLIAYIFFLGGIICVSFCIVHLIENYDYCIHFNDPDFLFLFMGAILGLIIGSLGIIRYKFLKAKYKRRSKVED